MTSRAKEKLLRRADRLSEGFQVFIGVDQTGASSDSGKSARPLPAAVLFQARHGSKQKLILKTADQNGARLSLPSLSPQKIHQLLINAGVPRAEFFATSKHTLLLVDSVFGLAKDAWPLDSPPGEETLWRLFQKASQHSGGYGMKPAAEFFERLLKESHWAGETPYPVRQCEVLSGANSVFRTRPYQKNIQCGTYRMWRDLGSSEPWLNFRFFTPARFAGRDRPWIFEAYPSLLWRVMLSQKTRKPEKLGELLPKLHPRLEICKQDLQIMTQAPDWADAAVLALGGWWLKKKKLLFQGAPHQDSKFAVEGWIIGIPSDADFS